jgi:hypothetical protein
VISSILGNDLASVIMATDREGYRSSPPGDPWRRALIAPQLEQAGTLVRWC